MFSSSKPCGQPPPKRAGQMAAHRPHPPAITADRPPGALLVTLLTFNGSLGVLDSFEFEPEPGIVIHAKGDVRNGFQLEIKRNHNLLEDDPRPSKQIPLQWVGESWINEPAMLNHGIVKIDSAPCCPLEDSLFKIPAPEKTLRAAHNMDGSAPGKITQRDCQTWIVESTDQAVRDGAFTESVAAYLYAIKQ
ncbi:hypothetical protein N7468_009135 [Penicillium chermesinum]|uniref:Uncharacterized protein n=1 Tax=Penicillium chermesinum TaxID=63820 RepID=A0A9W9NH99_9EURO|nr:uncharacterized protein N7468_009135 [Penicillium chermesinum]KAJ5219931.1 hypothetical protein N7468_009135 [Penicillium chermesinum]KAJ6157390.1 hypothetical protein N7470_004982 [Penicillium chermesinum]